MVPAPPAWSVLHVLYPREVGPTVAYPTLRGYALPRSEFVSHLTYGSVMNN